MSRLLLPLFLVLTSFVCTAQSAVKFTDSIRRVYKIPEVGYAVVSSDSVYEMNVLGVRKINTRLKAGMGDRFRMGSNTKAITGFIAARLVKQGKLSWHTNFFDLYPEMKGAARKDEITFCFA